MNRFVSDLKQHWNERPFIWDETRLGSQTIALPVNSRVLILAPHPDDPESVAVTCKMMARAGCDIHYAIVTLSPSGVDDDYAQTLHGKVPVHLKDKKIEIRRREQMTSAKMFGLAQDAVTFLAINEQENGASLDSPENRDCIKTILKSLIPDIVIMPIGKDTNSTHVWVYQVFRKYVKDVVCEIRKPIVAMYNEDPKTIDIRADVLVLFEEERANWKAELLRTHNSQHQRNLLQRKIGFDERILSVNRQRYQRHLDKIGPMVPSTGYAEVFELEIFDFALVTSGS